VKEKLRRRVNMFQELKSYYNKNSDCDECNKKNVCKYKEAFTAYILAIKGVSKDQFSPFEATITCDEFIEDKTIRGDTYSVSYRQTT
jgi:hypothetical protein